METTKVYSDLLAAYIDPAVRIIALQGSSRSSKTYSTLQLFNTIVSRTKKKHIMSVVSETLPHLKRGAIRDFKDILETDGLYNDRQWNGTDMIWTAGKGMVEFFSGDKSGGKAKGPQRDDLFVNEANHVDYEVFRQLQIRTANKIIIDYNPAFDSWIDEYVLPQPTTKLIHSTYLDNDMLSAAQIADIESFRDIDPDWWTVYGLGQKGTRAGLCLRAEKWTIGKMPPKNLWRKALVVVDFGWSNPSAVVLLVESEGKIYAHELLYQRHARNETIANSIKDAGLSHLDVICDSASPGSIDELVGYGIRGAVPTASKDVQLGLQIMNRWDKVFTEESVNLIDEARKYRHKKDPHTDKYIDDVVKAFDHGMDAMRYGFLSRFANVAVRTSISIIRGR